MSLFQQQSINKQISVVFMLILIISLLASGSALVFFEYLNKKNDFADELKTIAQLTASRSTAAIEFEHQEDLQEILDSLQEIKTIDLVCAYKDNLLLTSYQRRENLQCNGLNKSTGIYFSGSILEVIQPSKQFDTQVGMISIKASLDELNQSILISFLIMFIIIIITSIIAYQFLAKSQKAITEPILDLAKIANRIAKEKNYSLSTIPECAKEINMMYVAFANMLDKINENEDQLIKSERRLQAIIDNGLAIISIKDLDGRYSYSNQQFHAVFNTDPEQVIGSKNTDFLTTSEAENQKQRETIALKTQKPVEFEENLLIDNVIHHFISVKIPLMDLNDKTYAICSMSTDITESKNQAELLKRSQKMEALGKLTGGIAHDYNNMLAVILGFAQLIESLSVDSPQITNFAQEIMKAGNRGSKLTTRLLAFSRNKLAEAKDVDVTKLINSEKHMLEKTLTARIILNLELEENIWPVWLDLDDLEDAILNICINAMHAIENSGELSISTSNEIITGSQSDIIDLTPGHYVLIKIRDSGFGMGEDVLGHIFDPFFSTKGEKGTGLGLSQVYGFVKRSRGGINVESEPGKGTIFYLYFPRSNHINEVEEVVHVEEIKDYQGKESILVVDDEVALLRLSDEILTRAGYRIVCAESAEAALEIMQNDTFDLLLSDVIMPGMSGYALAKIVREQYPEIKIQLVSGYDSNVPANEEDSILKANILSKPYGDIKLLKTINDILNHD